MVDEPRALGWAAIVDSLFERIKNEAYVDCLARLPADDRTGIGIDDEGDIHEAPSGGDVSKVADPEHIRRRYAELPVHLV